MLKIFKLKDYFERLLCWLDHWLSCILDCIYVCVFLLSKNYFEKLAWHLLDTLLSVELLNFFLIAISIASRHLVDRLRKLLSPRYLLDTWWINRDLFSLLLICPSTDPLPLHLSTPIMLDTYLAISWSIEIPLHAFHFSLFCIFFPLCP